jgi:PucR C-terminal helix-turn-helix domain
VADLAAQLQDVVDEVSDLLGSPAVLEDTGFTLVAYCSQGTDVDPVRTASILGRTATPAVREFFLEHGIASATGPVHVPGDAARQITARVCLPARSGGRTLGYLWVLEPEGRLPRARLSRAAPLAERAGALLATRQQGVDEHERLVGDLLADDPAAARAARAGLVARGELPASGPVVVAVVRTPGGSVRRRVYPGPAVDAVDDESAGPGLGPVTRRVSRLVGVEGRAGVSAPRTISADLVGADVDELRAAGREADVAARVGLGRPGLGRVLTWPDLCFYRVALDGVAVVEALIAATPAARLRARAEPELVRTALAYLDEAGHAARTAATLGVHRQTLYYRLDRVEQLTGIDLGQGEARLQLHVGLALGEVVPYLREPGQ